MKPIRKDSKFGLIADKEAGKIWKACALMSKCTDWVYLEDLVAFIMARQSEAVRAQFRADHPSTVYAKIPTPTDMRIWDEPTILHKLHLAEKQGLVNTKRTDNGYYIFAAPKRDHYPWKLQKGDYELPYDPAWEIKYRTLTEVKHVESEAR